MKKIIESSGQRISERPTNRPYNIENDVLVRNSLNRELQKVDKLNQQRKKEVEKDIQNWLDDCNECIDLIYEYNDSVDEDLDLTVEKENDIHTYTYHDLNGDCYEGCAINLMWIDESTKINVTYGNRHYNNRI